jgi:tetratricopeptide (TPR) repeat protein
MINLGIKEFKEAIRLNPDTHYLHSMLGYLYRSKGLHDLSIFELKEALRLSRSAGNHKQLGIAFERKGEFDEAINEYYEALVVDPKLQSIHLNLAWTYFLQNRFSDSISEINRYLGPPGGGEQPFSMQMLWGRMKETRRQHLPMDITLCLYFSMRQNGEIGNGLQMLGDYEKIFKGKKWEFRLVQYLLGKATEAEVTVETKNRCNHAIVFFFIAYDYFAKGNNQKAVEYFQKTLDTNVLGYRVYAWAEIMLKRLK